MLTRQSVSISNFQILFVLPGMVKTELMGIRIAHLYSWKILVFFQMADYYILIHLDDRCIDELHIEHFIMVIHAKL